MEKDNTHPKILNLSLEILSPYLIPGYRFIVDGRQNNNEISYALKDYNQPYSRTDAKENSIPVVLMKNGYWMGGGFTFYKKKNNKKLLKQLCFHFFDEKTLLFRTDWACSEIKESKNHAQPHWHFDAETIIKRKQIQGFDVNDFNKFREKEERKEEDLTLDLGRFHFFMNWDIAGDNMFSVPYLDFCNDSVFCKWFTKAMQYIDSELRFLAKR